jgi:hypothetical protein
MSLKSFVVANWIPPVEECGCTQLYLKEHQGNFASDLPIGSGEIESAHCYIIQSQLKCSGSWWTVKNTETILALRVLRVNQD